MHIIKPISQSNVCKAYWSTLVGCVTQFAECWSLAENWPCPALACSRCMTTMWVNRLLQISQLSQLNLLSFWGW